MDLQQCLRPFRGCPPFHHGLAVPGGCSYPTTAAIPGEVGHHCSCWPLWVAFCSRAIGPQRVGAVAVQQCAGDTR
eukprot:11189703-Lingulodinium_polyedra.AAC.1